MYAVAAAALQCELEQPVQYLTSSSTTAAYFIVHDARAVWCMLCMRLCAPHLNWWLIVQQCSARQLCNSRGECLWPTPLHRPSRRKFQREFFVGPFPLGILLRRCICRCNFIEMCVCVTCAVLSVRQPCGRRKQAVQIDAIVACSARFVPRHIAWRDLCCASSVHTSKNSPNTTYTHNFYTYHARYICEHST
jgi:hypothetical protein